MAFNINMVIILYQRGEPDWPREESKPQKEKQVQEIESGNEEEARTGLYNMFAPCIMACTI